MKRIEKIGEVVIKTITLPVRICLGIFNSVKRNMPERLEMPFEIKRKESEQWFKKL
jgi:hypothetical protein|tara:strand:- start:393 stop:560 length:168 start_codon:yes stop_codon:yes gene_type:complete